MAPALDGFTKTHIDCAGVKLAVHHAGNGPPLVLLHGFPENHRCWAATAPEFAKHFHVIVPDLRGYGDSDAPADDARHSVYAKRTMACDISAVLDHFDHSAAALLGHDRGARVAYRFALDFPERLTRIGIIEIVPTAEFWAAWNAEIALAAYHWTFLAQPHPMPERLIGADPVAWLDWTLAAWTRDKSLKPFPGASLQSYRDQIACPERLHAMCADYRAGAGPDRQTDLADQSAGRRIAAPLRLLWGDSGFPARTGDPLAIWQRWATDATGARCTSGHFIPEENPAAVLREFLPFFRQDVSP